MRLRLAPVPTARWHPVQWAQRGEVDIAGVSDGVSQQVSLLAAHW